MRKVFFIYLLIKRQLTYRKTIIIALSFLLLRIDVNGAYSLNNRQVGRVVVWEYGFSCYGNNNPVCIYTDDHYATFQEYDCMGGFAHRFNSERSVVNKVYTPLVAL